MKAVLVQLRGFVGSLAGRVTLILAVGMAAASILSLAAAEQARLRDFARIRQERVAASTFDLVDRITRDPARTDQFLANNQILGARMAPPGWRMNSGDAALSRALSLRLGPAAEARAMEMSRTACFPQFNEAQPAAGMSEVVLPDCWFVTFKDGADRERRLVIDVPPVRAPPSSTLDPVYLGVILFASGVLALLVARWATTPLRRLARAADAFSLTIDPEPIPERGPQEVRAALSTFNLMQHRIREGFRERTHILAAIAHDLQTPLTRLRLRLEQVPDEALKARLIADLSATQQLVRDGLDLARSSEMREEWSVVDVDSILSSLAEDAAEFGHDVRFTRGCGARVRVKPNALARCLGNLIDNAVKYGGGAELSCLRERACLVICVGDHGPGIPPNLMEQVMQPFRRLEPARPTSGTGLGLSIARAQAQSFGATLALQNKVGGGLLATVRVSAS